MTMRHLALLALLLAPSIPRPTGACDRAAGDGGPQFRDSLHSADVVPPSAVTATFDVFHDDNGEGGCGSTCTGDSSHIRLDLAATDDRAMAREIGYQFAIVSGQPPDGIRLPSGPLLATYEGHLELPFDGRDRNFAFALEIRAVDLNGNVGLPTIIDIASQ